MIELDRLWKTHTKETALIIIGVVVFDIFLWGAIINTSHRETTVHFFDVGQGDSELVRLGGNALMLVDGGPANDLVIENLNRTVLEQRRYIDIVFLSHPQIDHFGGLLSVFEQYQVGALLHSGKRGEGIAAREFWDAASRYNIREIVLEKGDRICFRSDCFSVLSPSHEDKEKLSENDLSLALLLQAKGSKLLFIGDSGSLTEDKIAAEAGLIDVLKVSHHGSKFSSSEQFLRAVMPRIAVIEVGKNSYGHPSPDTLARLKKIGASVLRTDERGTISLIIEKDEISIFAREMK